MSMYRLALQNVKSSFKNYLSLILSLAFTILIFLNFQNVVFSDVLSVLGEHNKSYTDMLIETLSVVLGFFMFFFTGYATNVFLTRRKKEIGIYVFMGLSNQKIGRLYMLEMTLVGIATLILGTGFGILTTQLFQMILLSLSDIALDIGFHFTLPPILITIVFFLAVYLFYVFKGYLNIVKSSVLNLVSASRQNEYVQIGAGILMLKTILGIGLLSVGYYLAVKKGGMEVMGNIFAATLLVICGVYFLFGGFIPIVFQHLCGNKHFLYHKERCLWINQMIFRMKKNYRTYAIVCILMICSVTALSTSFAMKGRYEKMVHFRNTYTYQLLSSLPSLEEKAKTAIEADNDIAIYTKTPVLSIEDSSSPYFLVSYSNLKQLAKDGGLDFDIPPLKDYEIVNVEHVYMLSLLTDRSAVSVTLSGRTYEQIDAINTPYLGYLQESISFYLVSDAEYDRLRSNGTELYTYNFKISDSSNFKASLKELDKLTSNTKQNYTARIVCDPDSSDIEWVKILYSLGIFMFLVFVLASGCILFMKLFNDAFEEKARYSVLLKLGCSYKALKHSVSMELLCSYALPFFVMAVSSYFSVHALENMMYTSLKTIWIISMGVIFVLFFFCYAVSVRIYLKNAGIRRP